MDSTCKKLLCNFLEISTSNSELIGQNFQQHLTNAWSISSNAGWIEQSEICLELVAQFCCAVLPSQVWAGQRWCNQMSFSLAGWRGVSLSWKWVWKQVFLGLEIGILSIVNTKFKSKTFNEFSWFLTLSTHGLCLVSLALNVNFLSHLGWLWTSIKSCLVPALFVCVSVCVLIIKHHQNSSHVHPWMEEALQVWEWGEGWKSLLEVVALPQPGEMTVRRGRMLNVLG